MLRPTRRAAAATAIGLVIGFGGGCGKETAASGTPHVAYLAASMTRNYSLAMIGGFRNAVAQIPGVTQEVTAPPADADPIRQIAILNELTKTAKGGIAFSAVAPENFVEALAQAHANGIPLAAVDIPPPDGSGVTLYVGNDNEELGKTVADLVIDQLPAGIEGTVVLGSPRPGLPPLDLRSQGIREQFAARLPKVKVKGPFDTTGNPVSTLKAWRQLSEANPKALAMLSVGADGGIIAKVRHDRKATWKAAAFDIDAEGLAAIKRGDLLLVSPEHFLKGAIAGKLLAEAAEGTRELPKGWIQTPALTISPKNVDEIIQRETSDATRMAWCKQQLADMFAGGGPKMLPLDQAA
jgi:ribose transport system substrate-binding protein